MHIHTQATTVHDGTKNAFAIRADFKGLFGESLAYRTNDTCEDSEGDLIALKPGMVLTAFDEDVDDTGIGMIYCLSNVQAWRLRCRGSRWVLRIDGTDVRHDSDLRNENA